MVIQDQKTLKQVQDEFNTKFPFLQIEFYASPHHAGEGSPFQQKLDNSKLLSDVRAVHNEGELSINPNQKISTLEHNFADKFGLYVQVFRRSGNLWLQSNKTDHWTLAEANRKGEHSVEAYQEKYES